VDLDQVLARIDQARETISAHNNSVAVHAFTKAVNDLGYIDDRALQSRKVSHAALVKEAIGYLRSYLERSPTDAVALNNLGVLLADNGDRSEPRRLFRAALKLAPNDSNVHENLMILDILAGKPKARWHAVPEDTHAGELTLTAYFDPHGM
jgi:tetratricopeptide (TPR) repeat protein